MMPLSFPASRSVFVRFTRDTRPSSPLTWCLACGQWTEAVLWETRLVMPPQEITVAYCSICAPQVQGADEVPVYRNCMCNGSMRDVRHYPFCTYCKRCLDLQPASTRAGASTYAKPAPADEDVAAAIREIKAITERLEEDKAATRRRLADNEAAFDKRRAESEMGNMRQVMEIKLPPQRAVKRLSWQESLLGSAPPRRSRILGGQDPKPPGDP